MSYNDYNNGSNNQPYNNSPYGSNPYGGNPYDNQYGQQYGNQYSNQYGNQQYGNQTYNTQYNQYNQGYNNQQFGYDTYYNTPGASASSSYAKDEISDLKYNLIIGGALLWGFLVNVFMVQTCYDGLLRLIIDNPIMFYVAYFAMVVVGVIMTKKSDSPVVSFIGYNLIVVPLGMVIAVSVGLYISVGYQSVVVAAFGITAVVTLVMMALASIFPGFFLSLGRTLGVSLLVTVIAEIVLMIAGVDLGITCYIVVLLFCGYIGFDWSRANRMPKTVDNAIDSAADLYVDIANLF